MWSLKRMRMTTTKMMKRKTTMKMKKSRTSKLWLIVTKGSQPSSLL